MEDISFVLKLIWAIVLFGIIVITIYVALIQMKKSDKMKKGDEEFERKKCQECGKMFWVSKSLIGDYLREPKYCGPCNRKLLAEIDEQIAKSLENYERSR